MFSRPRPEETKLKPLPLSQREKSYSAESGYVYQYIFLGLEGTRHVFDVTADRKNRFRVAVELTEPALAGVKEKIGPELRWNELYAIAKLSLFAAFDAMPDPAAMRQVVEPDADEVMEYLSTLKMLP
jgi:hypothetical protein